MLTEFEGLGKGADDDMGLTLIITRPQKLLQEAAILNRGG
jgi:hypothetical protein